MKESGIKKIDDTYVYNKNKMLGKGSYGEVYLGFDEISKNPIAVKVISL